MHRVTQIFTELVNNQDILATSYKISMRTIVTKQQNKQRLNIAD